MNSDPGIEADNVYRTDTHAVAQGREHRLQRMSSKLSNGFTVACSSEIRAQATIWDCSRHSSYDQWRRGEKRKQMMSSGPTCSIFCLPTSGRTHSNRVSAPHSAHAPMAHPHGMIERGLSRSCGLSPDLQDSFLGELEAIRCGGDPDGPPPESQC